MGCSPLCGLFHIDMFPVWVGMCAAKPRTKDVGLPVALGCSDIKAIRNSCVLSARLMAAHIPTLMGNRAFNIYAGLPYTLFKLSERRFGAHSMFF